MKKQVCGSAIETETTQDLKEKVQSQAATIKDLEEQLQSQSADWRDLQALYKAREERSNNKCFALQILCDQYKDEAVIASSKDHIEVNNLHKRLKDVNESKLQDLESLKGVKKYNERLLQEKKDLSKAAGVYMDKIAKWKTKAQSLKEENESHQQALKQAREEKRDLTRELQEAKNENGDLKELLSEGFYQFLTADPPAVKSESAEVNFSSQLDLDDLDEHQSKRRRCR